MRILAFMTATAVEIAPEVEDSGIELHGWIDKGWSMTHLHDNRNDVEPLMNLDETDSEGLADEIREILGDPGLYFDNGDGSFYIHDSINDDGMEYTYCVHFKRKFLGPNGWDETEWHPETDGGIVLNPESVSV